MQKRLIVIITISLLSAIAIFLAVECFLLASELNSVKASLKTQETNAKAVFFAKLFIDNILLSSGTVNFDERLKLENAIRDLNDPEIFAKWQKLTSSSGNAETQQIVGSILKMLINKISPQISPK